MFSPLRSLLHVAQQAVSAGLDLLWPINTSAFHEHADKLWAEAAEKAAADALADKEAGEEVAEPGGASEPRLDLTVDFDPAAFEKAKADLAYIVGALTPIADVWLPKATENSAAPTTVASTSVAADSPSESELRAHSPEGRLTAADLLAAAGYVRQAAREIPSGPIATHLLGIADRIDNAATADSRNWDLPAVSRVEVIDHRPVRGVGGRALIADSNIEDVLLSFQDDGTTLKVLIK